MFPNAIGQRSRVSSRSRINSRSLREPQARSDSWFHSQEFDSEYRQRRAQQRAWFQHKAEAAGETIADPDDFQPSLVAARNRYFDSDKKPRRRGDPCQELPSGTDLQAFADTFFADPQRLVQGEAMQRLGLSRKAKRLVLCGRIGHRVNCTGCEGKFFQEYFCRCRYCVNCGPVWFRKKFSDMLMTLEPVVAHLLHEGEQRGQRMVIAKLDFTVRNTGTMPTPEFVRKFHADRRRFWRAVEKRFGISRKEYGFVGCDEFGGNNTNLHMHCVYVGPWLPQKRKELSALWSEIRGERSFVSIKPARSFSAALAHALQYPAKFLDASTPKRLAELEATFHKTRRFSAGGAFYNVKPTREPGEDSPVGECPHCGARLVEIVEPWQPVFVLENEGRRSVDQVRREVAKARVLAGPGP